MEDPSPPIFSAEREVNEILWERVTADQQAAEIRQTWPARAITRRNPVRSVFIPSAHGGSFASLSSDSAAHLLSFTLRCGSVPARVRRCPLAGAIGYTCAGSVGPTTDRVGERAHAAVVQQNRSGSPPNRRQSSDFVRRYGNTEREET